MIRLLPAAAVTVLLAAFAVAASACGSTDSHSRDVGVLSAMNILQGSGLHEMDDLVVNSKKLPPTGETVAVRLQTTLTLTGWPKDLKDPAKKLADLFGKMATALHGDNPDFKAAGDAIHAAHEAWHQFTDLAWDYLMKQAKVGDTPMGHDD